MQGRDYTYTFEERLWLLLLLTAVGGAGCVCVVVVSGSRSGDGDGGRSGSSSSVIRFVSFPHTKQDQYRTFNPQAAAGRSLRHALTTSGESWLLLSHRLPNASEFCLPQP